MSSCSVGFIESGSDCLACNESCFDCDGNTETCTSCPQNSYLYETTCVTDCPEGYVVSTGTCIQDNTECATGCSDGLLTNDSCDSVCNTLSCNYDDGMCVSAETECLENEYEVDNECFECQDPCEACLSPNTCTTCMIDPATDEKMLLYDSYCYSTCPDGTFENGIVCEDCYIRCASCVGSESTESTSCEDPY